MTYNTIVFLSAMIAGLSTALGALPIYFKKNFTQSNLDVGMGFSAGIMLVASFVSLIIPGLEAGREVFPSPLSLFSVLAGIVFGYLFIVLIHDFLPHDHIFKKTDMKHKTKASRVTLIVLAIALHNFPEGLSVGVGFGTNDVSAGLSLALAIAIQNIPEGLVVAIGLLSVGATKNKAFLMALLSGLVEPLAAGIGFLSTQVTVYALPVSLGFAGGTMLFVICQEIFPELFREGYEKRATFGVVAGVITMLIIDFYFA